MKKKNGFKTTCLKCGCEECTVTEDYDYNNCGNLEFNGIYYNCPNCGQDSRFCKTND